MHYQFLIIFLAVCLVSCSSTHNKPAKEKFDVPLLQKIEEVKKKGTNETIQIFGKCQGDIDDRKKIDIEKTGIKVESVVGNIFTGAGTINSLQEMAKLDFVDQIHLATINEPY